MSQPTLFDAPVSAPPGAPGLGDPVVEAFRAWELARRSGDWHLGKVATAELRSHGISVCATAGRGGQERA